MKYQAEVEEANPVSSFSLPPDTPALSQATSFTDQASDSGTDAHSLPTLQSSDSECGAAAGCSNRLRQPVFGQALIDRQHSVHSFVGAQSSPLPTLVRLMSPRRKSVGNRPVASLRQPGVGSTKPRVIADSATILSFAELRRSMEGAADQSDEDSD